MAEYKVNKTALSHAKSLIKKGAVEKDQRDDWSEDASSTDEANKFIDKNGMSEYGRWHLAIEADGDRENKGTYRFPYGDFKKVHRGAVIAAKVRASQYDHTEIRDATDELLQLIDEDK